MKYSYNMVVFLVCSFYIFNWKKIMREEWKYDCFCNLLIIRQI